MSASSSSISITTSSNSASRLPLCNKSLSSQTLIVSTKTHLKTPKFALKFNTHYSDFSPLPRSSLFSPNFQADGVAHVAQNPESELSGSEEQDEKEEDEEEDYDDDGEEESESESPDARRLYVGNLPFSLTSSELSEIFGEAGNVADVQIVYNKVTGRSRGFAFVTMGSATEANEAIRMFDGAQIGGRTVKVNFPEVPRGGEREVIGPKISSSNRKFIESPHKLYAGNLSWIITSERLKDVFADQPGLLSAKVIYEREYGKSRGFGFITFNSPEAAESALSAMNGVEVEGRPMRLSMAGEKADVSPSKPGTSSGTDTDGNEILSSGSS